MIRHLILLDNIIGIYTQPSNLQVHIEDPVKYMPLSLPENDVMLAINLHPDIISEFPNLAKNAGTRLIIAPIEEPNWLSIGLRNQIKEKCEKLGIIFAAPKPFCSLKKGEHPIKIGIKSNNIVAVQVLCSQPCGSITIYLR